MALDRSNERIPLPAPKLGYEAESVCHSSSSSSSKPRTRRDTVIYLGTMCFKCFCMLLDTRLSELAFNLYILHLAIKASCSRDKQKRTRKHKLMHSGNPRDPRVTSHKSHQTIVWREWGKRAWVKWNIAKPSKAISYYEILWVIMSIIYSNVQ